MNINFKKFENNIELIEDEFKMQTKFLFDEVLNELKQTVETIIRQGKLEIKSFEIPGRKKYINLFEQFLWEVLKEGMVSGLEEIQAEMTQFSPDTIPDTIISEETLKWLETWKAQSGNEYYADLTSDVIIFIRNSIENGLTSPETMNALRLYFTKFNCRRLFSIAGTNVAMAFNRGRMEIFRQNSNLVKAYKFNTYFDTKVCEICKLKLGKIFLPDDPELSSNSMLFHYNCRSILSPIIDHNWEEIQKET
jgi:SPP1 gp7 family putative phage head morphogenesis protein